MSCQFDHTACCPRSTYDCRRWLWNSVSAGGNVSSNTVAIFDRQFLSTLNDVRLKWHLSCDVFSKWHDWQTVFSKMAHHAITEVATKIYAGQKPGNNLTSLRIFLSLFVNIVCHAKKYPHLQRLLVPKRPKTLTGHKNQLFHIKNVFVSSSNNKSLKDDKFH